MLQSIRVRGVETWILIMNGVTDHHDTTRHHHQHSWNIKLDMVTVVHQYKHQLSTETLLLQIFNKCDVSSEQWLPPEPSISITRVVWARPSVAGARPGGSWRQPGGTPLLVSRWWQVVYSGVQWVQSCVYTGTPVEIRRESRDYQPR